MPQMGFLSGRTKFIKVEDHTTAGTSAVESATVDMAQDGGYEGVVFLTSFGTAATDNTAEVAQSSDDSSFDDLVGSKVASGSSDEDVWIDVFRPQERYLRMQVARGTSSTLESIWAVLYNPRKVPVDNTTSGTIIGEAHNSPIEGTA